MRGIFCFVLVACLCAVLPVAVLAQGIDAQIDAAVAPLSALLFSIVFYPIKVFGNDMPAILLWLLPAPIFFTLYLRFINLRGFAHAFRLIRGRYNDPRAPGVISHFKALATELSGTVGLGNIAGVAIAISVGGPGAAFWMTVMGFLGMSMKFAECLLGVKYRWHQGEHFHGGPMYYLEKGFAKKGWPRVGRCLGVFFAISCVGGTIGAAALFQMNQSYAQILNVTGGANSYFADKGWLVGLVTAALVGVVIIGGIRSIAGVASRIVPLMTVIYVGACLYVLMSHWTHIDDAVVTIVTSAFNLDAGVGGLMGTLIAGIRRATFSNEAGLGTAPMSHSAVKTWYPATEAYVGMTGPFFDTLVICNMTALVVVISGVWQGQQGMGGIELTSQAFAQTVSWFPYVLTAAVWLFAYSTMITWSYYGAKSTTYLFGESPRAELFYKIIICAFIVVGAVSSLNSVVNLTDALSFMMAVPNLIGVYLLAPEIRKDMTAYEKMLKRHKGRHPKKPEAISGSFVKQEY